MIEELQLQFIEAVANNDWKLAEKITFRIDQELRKEKENDSKKEKL